MNESSVDKIGNPKRIFLLRIFLLGEFFIQRIKKAHKSNVHIKTLLCLEVLLDPKEFFLGKMKINS